jgi:DNA-binding Xre family transcriptional regulator
MAGAALSGRWEVRAPKNFPVNPDGHKSMRISLRFRFGDIVLLGRTLRGWSLRDLAKVSGISNPFLSQLETGKCDNPTIDVVEKLARAFGCTPGTLLDRCYVDARTTPGKERR